LKPFVVGCDLVGCNFFCGSVNFWWRRISGHFWNCLAAGATSIVFLQSFFRHRHSSLPGEKKIQQFEPGLSYAAFACAGNCAEAQLQYAKLRIGGLFLRKANSLGSKITSREIISLFYNKACNSNFANMGFATGFVSFSLLSGHFFFHGSILQCKG
jgi:hypothetical protein